MMLVLDVDFVTFGLLPATENVLAFFLQLRMSWSMRLMSRLGLDQLENASFLEYFLKKWLISPAKLFRTGQKQKSSYYRPMVEILT